MEGFVPGLVLGALLGGAVVGLVALALAQTLARITGRRDAASVVRFVASGLVRGGRRDGTDVERGLSRLLRDQYAVLASGARMAAGSIVLHVGPEDFTEITSTLGTDAAARDLAEYYLSHARESGWRILTEPRITIERDISLRPRQARATRSMRTSEPAGPRSAPGVHPSVGAPMPAGFEHLAPNPPETSADRAPMGAASTAGTAAGDAPAGDSRMDEAVTGVLPRAARPGTAPTDVLPGGVDRPGAAPAPTAVIGEAVTEVLSVGDLLVRNGTDQRSVTRAQGRALVGRASYCDIVVSGVGVSREHARLELQPDGWSVVPLSTKNGTTLGGERIEGPTRIGGIALLGLGNLARLELVVDGAD